LRIFSVGRNASANFLNFIGTKDKLFHFGNFFSLTKHLKVENNCKKNVRDFWEAHPDSEQQLKAWYQETSKAEWTGSTKIKIEYPSASFLASNRVVFNIKGNQN
jgi:hypothetical protein